MTANIEVRNFKPEVEIDVILLTSLVGSVILTSRASDNEELIVEAADGVSMTCIFELIHCNAVKRVGSIIDDLIALLQRGRSLVDFTTTDQEQFVAWSLNVHEIVLE